MSVNSQTEPLWTHCRHCNETLSGGAAEGFCCLGCATAYSLISGSGLGAFYDRFSQQSGGRPLRPDVAPVNRADLALNVITEADGRCSLYLMVDGLHCAACVWLIESMLAQQPDILAGRVNFSTRRLKLSWQGEAARAEKLVALIESLGFHLAPYDPVQLAQGRDRVGQELLRCVAVSGFAAGNVMLLSVSVWAGQASFMGASTRDLLHWLSALIALPAILYAGMPFFRSAAGALAHGRSNMDVPISIGVLLASAISLSETIRHGAHAYYDSAITLLFFLLIGRLLDHRARGKTREAAAHLLSLKVTAITRLTDAGQCELVPLAGLRVGDLVQVAAGERVAADGPLLQGQGDVDSSLLTGESLPQPVKPGSLLFAGMVNLSAPILMRVTAVGENTLLAEIVRLMEAAEGGRAAYRRLADRLSRLYAPFVHCAALTTFVVWLLAGGMIWQDALLRAVAVLIITCPCALGLAIPAVQVVASGRLMARGILLKSATALERLAEIDQVAFDKTGTLTLGLPRLANENEISAANLRLAASLARASRHPLARALSAACPVAPLRDGVEELPGRGLQADTIRLGSRAWLGLPDSLEAGAELWLSQPGQTPVRFRFDEEIRPDSDAVIDWLQRRNVQVSLLSGDRAVTVRRLAKCLRITSWSSGLNPAAKVARVSEMRRRGSRVLMVGDGLNDAPALAAADVSLSPSSAADITQNTADVVFQGQSLDPVRELLVVARAAKRIIRQNLAFALIYNLAAMPLAIFGLVTPAVAAALMSSSSLIVVLNALRLRRPGSGES